MLAIVNNMTNSEKNRQNARVSIRSSFKGLTFDLFKIYFATGIFGRKSRGFLKRGGSMIIGGPRGPVRRGRP